MHVTQRRPAAARDGGFSLIELLVVIFLLGIVGAVATAGMASAMRSTRQHAAISSNSGRLQAELERMTREIRVADPLRVATGSDLVVDVYRAGGCREIEWRISGGTLQQRTRTWTSPSACAVYPATAAVATDSGYVTRIRNVTSATPFTYLDHAGTALSTVTTVAVAQISVTLTQSQAELRAPLTVTGSADLRNAS